MSGAWPQAGASHGARAGAVALIALVHILLAALFLRHGAVPEDATPASYIAFALIPAPKPVQPVAKAEAPLSMPAPVVRRLSPVSRQAPAPLPVIPQPQPLTARAPVAVVEIEPSVPLAQPGIDMAALRAAARRIDSERTPTPAESEPLRAIDDSKLARAVREAKRPDCQTKYSGGDKLDLIRLIPLAIETITDKGCKW
jgi:hypothetical protein